MEIANRSQQYTTRRPNYDSKPQPADRGTSKGGDNSYDFKGREGFDDNFLGVSMPLPQLDDSIKDKAATLLADPSKTELEYTHFSIVQNKERRAPFFTAANVDGAQWHETGRDGKWGFDGRIDRKFQLGPEAYGGNNFDKGHMTRRRDPMWGADANNGSDDTFVYTNCALQHSALNQHKWLNLENFVLDRAIASKSKVNVFTGPVFTEEDPKFDNKGKMSEPTQIPRAFWKMAVWNDPAKGLVGEAYVMSQDELLGGKGGAGKALEELSKPEDFQPYRIPVEQLSKITHINFGPITNQP